MHSNNSESTNLNATGFSRTYSIKSKNYSIESESYSIKSEIYSIMKVFIKIKKINFLCNTKNKMFYKMINITCPDIRRISLSTSRMRFIPSLSSNSNNNPFASPSKSSDISMLPSFFCKCCSFKASSCTITKSTFNARKRPKNITCYNLLIENTKFLPFYKL